jgi:hypothetical protein
MQIGENLFLRVSLVGAKLFILELLKKQSITIVLKTTDLDYALI